MEEYINFYKKKVHPYVTLKKSESITTAEVEVKLPKPLFELHGVLTKILKDNNLLPNEEDLKLTQL